MTASTRNDPIFDRSYLAVNDNFYLRLVHDDPEDTPRARMLQAFRDGELPVSVPSKKAEARLVLATLGVGGDCSISRACANANLPLDIGWRGEIVEPPAPREWKPPHHKKPKREDLSNWPLAEALRRDGRGFDIPAVVRYRDLFDSVMVDPFSIAKDVGTREDSGIGFEYRSLKMSGVKEVDKAAKSGWPGDKIPRGEISYRERRTTSRMESHVGTRAGMSEDGDEPAVSHLDMGYREGDRLARIDGKPILLRIRDAVDVNPFNDEFSLWDLLNLAALGNSSFTDIGGMLGFKHKARSREAKVRVYTAVDILRDEWGRIKDRQVEEEDRCHRRVMARRAELAAQQAAYLRRAA